MSQDLAEHAGRGGLGNMNPQQMAKMQQQMSKLANPAMLKQMGTYRQVL
jgi:hypothetical protein